MEPRPKANHPASGAALAIYGLAVSGILGSYFLKYPIPEFWAKILATTGAFWLAFALNALGASAIWLVGWLIPVGWIRSLGPWNSRLLKGSAGFALLTFTVFILGWTLPGALHRNLQIVVVVLAVLSVAAAILRPVRVPNSPRVAPVVLVIVPAAGVLAAFLSSFSPVTYYDSLVYHLALPAIYLRDGQIGSVAYNLYSAFPGGCEAFFTFILGVIPVPEYTINVFGWIIALSLGAAVAEWTVQISGKRAGWISIALWWTMPPVLLLCQGGYVDIPLAAATYLSVRSMAAWLTDPESGATPAFAGFFCGLAISIKYTGAITGLILLAALCITRWKKDGVLKHALIFASAALILPLPWLIKNAVSLGNPVFPFLYRFLGGDVGWTGETASGYFSLLTEYSNRSNLIVDLLTPWNGVSSRGGFDVLGDFGWPLLMLAAIPAPLLSSKKEVRLLSGYFALHAVLWFFSKPVLRFLVPAMPIATLLAAVAISALISHRSMLARQFTVLMTTAWISSNVFLYGLAADELKLFAVPFGQFDSNEFLERRLAFYPTFERLNAEMKSGEKVLLVGEQRTYHLKVPFLTSNLFAPSPVAGVCNQAHSLNDISRFLSDNAVTRILVSEGEVKRLGGYERFGFTQAGEVAFKSFLANRAKPMSSDRGVNLFAVDGLPGSPQ